MANTNVILKNRPKLLSQDYDKLTALGLKYIEKFSKDLWTDYNAHDPGITSLEILNYVITDLAYRTSLPMEDILARLPGDTTKDFFTAREILPCNPVTFDDLRKKIIDVNGVENAWVTHYTDDICAQLIKHPAYYIRCNTTDPINIRIDAEPEPNFEKRNINGLYNFNLLLEEDAVLGDLNILTVDWEKRDSAGLRIATVHFTFPLNVQKTYPRKNGLGNMTAIELLTEGTITDYNIPVTDTANNTFDLVLTCSGGGIVTINNISFRIQPVHTNANPATLKAEVIAYINLLSQPPSPPLSPADRNKRKQEIIANIFQVFASKVKKAAGIIDDVYCQYHHVRNLCEDVISIGLVPSQEIAVCADIETDNAVDLEEILGKIYFYIDTFFSPPVRFYLLKELQEKKISTEIIFEGPVLKHGFILDEELQKKALFSEIHVSDLYNLIMSIEGVKTIRYLQITNYFNGIAKTEGELWKLDLNKDMPVPMSYHLNLDRLRSKIIFYKGDMPITADKQVANRIYNDLKATLSKPRINPALKILNDILPPVGTAYELDEYYSLQNEFPMVYGTGRDGIPSDADMTRKTKIKQLKGYLLFFDQLLTNYLAQLSEIKNLYAVGNQNNKTYFYQPVYDTQYPDTAIKLDPENNNFYGTAPLLKDFMMPAGVNIDDEASYAVQWDAFVNPVPGPLPPNSYMAKLEKLAEPEDDTLSRRNRFLDHLLSRFAENFAAYAAMMYKFTGLVLESKNKKTAAEIADDKLLFLQQYNVLSYNRGKGQYYKCCPTGDCSVKPLPPAQLSTDEILEYDTYNIPQPSNATGLHKRGATLLGIDSKDNSFLVENKFTVVPAAGNFKFVINYDTGRQFMSVNVYTTERKAFEAMEKIVPLIIEDNNANNIAKYFEVKPFGGSFRIEVKETLASIIAYAVSSPVYATILLANDGLQKLKEIFMYEGMHIIEHLLLRPLPVLEIISAADLTNGFFPLCASLNPDCDCPITDYYSFRISVVLPYWTERFRNMDFRSFAEDTIHRETPAHILPKFCWVSMFDMHRLETAYNAWFTENKKYKPAMSTLKVLLKELIKVLNTLSNVYPEGHLHDCDNPSTDNPVILDQTNLGTF